MLKSMLLAITVAVAIGASPSWSADDGGGAVLIKGAAVFDGERLLGRRDVLVSDGRIAEVGRNLRAPASVTRIDGRGRTLLPGLIDSHVHVFPTAAEDALRFGVTSEFDMFGLNDAATVQARRAQRVSYARTDKADVWSAGVGVTPPGGHPTQLVKGMGVDIPTLDAAQDPAAFVKDRADEGSDYIKVFQDESVGADGKPRFPEFTRARLGQIITAAHANGRKAVVHVSTEADARDVFELGGDAIAHMFGDAPAGPEVVAAAKANRAAIIGTLSVLAGASGDPAPARLAADPAIAPHLSPAQRGMLAAKWPSTRPQILANALESVRRFHAAGVIVLAGTDAPNPSTAHGPSIHEEMELLVRAGLSPAEAISAATSAPADFFGATDRGRIAAGKRADLVLVEGDPTREIAASRRIVGVWKNGHPVDRSRLPVMPQGPAQAAHH
jgi:imidazolonepropionase-like amidohydrolase